MLTKTISSNYIVKLATVSALVSAVLLANAAFAAKPVVGTDISSLSYLFHLYYDNGQLFADRDFQIKYDVVQEKYIPISSSAGFYKGEIVNIGKNKVVGTFAFDPKQGKISVKGPYAADALQVNFLDSSGKQVLTIFVSDSSFCDNNDFCDQAKGEDNKTCPNDCSNSKTPAPLASTIVNPNPTAGSQGLDLMTILIYVFSGLAAVAVAWVGWRWWKSRRSSSFPAGSSDMPMPPPPSVG